MADVVMLVEGRMKNLETENRVAHARATELDSEVVLVREQLAKREREVTRLGAQLEVARAKQYSTPGNQVSTGKPRARIIGIASLEAALDRIEQLETQIEFLQEHIESLEKEVGEMEREQGTVHATILNDKDDLAVELQFEKKRSKELLDNLAKLQVMVDELNDLKNGKQKAHHPSTNVPNSSVVKHIKRIAELEDKLKTTELKLETNTKRIGMFQREIAKSKSEKLKLSQAAAPLPTNAATQVVSTVENRDSDANVGKAELEAAERVHNRTMLQLEKKYDTALTELQESKSQVDRLSLKLESCDKMIDTLNSKLVSERGEVEHISRFYCSNIRERDCLIQALETFESQLSSVKSHISGITAEKDNAIELYKQMKEALEISQKQSKNKLPTQNILPDTIADSSIADRMEVDLSEARFDNKKLRETVSTLELEIQSLQADIQVMVQRQRDTGTIAGDALTQLETQVSEIKQSLQISENDRSELESLLATTRRELANEKDSNQGISRRHETAKIRISSLEIDQADLRLKVRELTSKLSVLELEHDKLGAAHSGIQIKLEERERQLGEQRELLSRVDKERDGFQDELDSKAEQLVQLEDKITALVTYKKTAEREVGQLTEHIESLSAHLNNQDRENQQILSQLEEVQRQKVQFQQTAKKYQDEATSLSSDLAALTRENQILNSEASKVASERDQLKAELKECDRQLQYLDQLIRSKDEEAQQLMHSYRKVISDHEKLEMNLMSTSEDLQSARMELVMRDKHIQQLQAELDMNSETLNTAKVDLAAYEKQCSSI